MIRDRMIADYRHLNWLLVGKGSSEWAVKFSNENSRDVIVVSPIKKTDNSPLIIPISEIRELKQKLSFYPSEKRFVVIEDAHLIVGNTAHTILKTLEESPPLTTFLLTSPSIRSVLPTIKSRCLTLFITPSRILPSEKFIGDLSDFENKRYLDINSKYKRSYDLENAIKMGTYSAIHKPYLLKHILAYKNKINQTTNIRITTNKFLVEVKNVINNSRL